MLIKRIMLIKSRGLADFGGCPDGGGASPAGGGARCKEVKGTELFEGEIDALGAYMTVEKSEDLGFGEAFGGADDSLADAAGDGIDGRAVEEKTSTGLAVVPYSECGLEMADLDERAAVERGVDGAEAKDLGFGAAGGGSVDVRTAFA